jgi:ketosteroid isomerase-like protein
MTPRETVENYFDCLNSENWEGLRSVFHPEASLQAVGTRERRGVDEIVGYFGRIFDPWETHIDQPTRIIEIGETVVAEVTFTGKPTAKTDEVRFDAVDVFDLQDRLIVTMSNWYDLTYVREMLR